jgi:hypothetical protein
MVKLEPFDDRGEPGAMQTCDAALVHALRSWSDPCRCKQLKLEWLRSEEGFWRLELAMTNQVD